MSKMVLKPNIALVVMPCILGSFMMTCGLHDYVMLSSGNQELIGLYFQTKPFYIIGTVQQVIPILVGLKVLLVIFKDMIAILRCKGTGSSFMGALFLAILGLIASQFVPMKQIEAKLLNGTATIKDIENGVILMQRILIGNISMITHGIVSYIVTMREYEADVTEKKTKKD